MLNPTFEKTIIDLLKTHYDLELCHLKALSNETNEYKTFRLHCKDNKNKYSYTLRMIIEPYNENNLEHYSFSIFSEDRTSRSCIDLSEKIYPSAIQKALVDIKNDTPKFLMDARFIHLLGHNHISLISGSYYHNGTDIVVNDLSPFVDTVSDIYFFSPVLPTATYTFCSVNIKGDKLYIRPIRGYENDSTFDNPVTFDDDGIKLFKAYIFKCLLIYSNSDRYNAADYLSLDCDEMKNYFLLLEMQTI